MRKPLHRRTKARGAFSAALVLACSLTACSTPSTGGGSYADGSFATSQEARAFTSSVEADVAAMQGKQLKAPPSVGPKAVATKTIAFVTITESDPSALQVLRGGQQAVAAIGWNQTTYNANGNQSDANRFMQQAVTTRPDAVVTIGLSKSQMGSGLASAKDAGIPVGCLACYDESDPNGLGEYATIEPTRSVFVQMGYAPAAFAYLQTKGNPKFITFNDSTVTNLAARQEGFDGFVTKCKAAGAACSVQGAANFQVANVTTTLAGQAAAFAQANPSFNAVWVSFDSAANYVMNGLRQAGKATGSSFMVSANGDPTNLDIIKQGGYQKMTIAVGGYWAGWAIVDNLNRIFAGQAPVEQNVPVRLFDHDNIAEAADWEGDVDFKASYKRIWGR